MFFEEGPNCSQPSATSQLHALCASLDQRELEPRLERGLAAPNRLPGGRSIGYFDLG